MTPDGTFHRGWDPADDYVAAWADLAGIPVDQERHGGAAAELISDEERPVYLRIPPEWLSRRTRREMVRLIRYFLDHPEARSALPLPTRTAGDPSMMSQEPELRSVRHRGD